MRLDARIRKRVGALQLDVIIRTDDTVALFGPSGAGKSTAIACLAGLARPDEGRVVLDGETLFDSERGIDVPSHARGVAWAFQDHRLFPHLDVRANLCFAPGADRGERMERVVDTLCLVSLLDRAPGDLSGGERGRVGLGRALLSPARLALLDEPTAGLDAAMRMRALALVQEAASGWGKAVVYVSHSPGEVHAVADRVIAIDRGRVMGEGAPMNVLTAGPVLALWREEGFENVFEGIAEGDGVRAGGALWRVGRGDLRPGEKVTLGLSASDVILARERPEALSARNVLPGGVARVTGSSEVVIATVDVGGILLAVELTPAATREIGIAAGARVWVIVKATSLRLTRSG